jgi:hypothetical protein
VSTFAGERGPSPSESIIEDAVQEAASLARHPKDASWRRPFEALAVLLPVSAPPTARRLGPLVAEYGIFHVEELIVCTASRC